MKSRNEEESRIVLAVGVCLLLAQVVPAAPTEQQIQECREKPTHKQQIKCACELGGGTFEDFGSEWGEDYACLLRDGWAYWCTDSVVALECRWIKPDLFAPGAVGWLVTSPPEVTTDGVEPDEPSDNPFGLPDMNGDDLVIVETDGEQGEVQAAPEALLAIDGVDWMPPEQAEGADPFAYLADAPLDYLESLLAWQQEGIIRADAPIAYYIELKLDENVSDETSDAADASTDDGHDVRSDEGDTSAGDDGTTPDGELGAPELIPTGVSGCGAAGFGMFGLPLLGLCCAAMSRRPRTRATKRIRTRPSQTPVS